MRTKHRELRDWVWIAIAITTFLVAILLSGLVEKWL